MGELLSERLKRLINTTFDPDGDGKVSVPNGEATLEQNAAVGSETPDAVTATDYFCHFYKADLSPTPRNVAHTLVKFFSDKGGQLQMPSDQAKRLAATLGLSLNTTCVIDKDDLRQALEGYLAASRAATSSPTTCKNVFANRMAAVVHERDELFMMSALAYGTIHNVPADTNLTGYDIYASLAWDVGDISKTPKFVIGRNENLQNQDERSHGEIVVMTKARAAVETPYTAAMNTRERRHDHYTHVLAGAKIYTTLEPCPMCNTTMILERVSEVDYCMEDNGLRSPDGRHERTLPVHTGFYGRTYHQRFSPLDICERANAAMWEASVRKLPQHMFVGDSFSYFNIIAYTTVEGPQIFGPGYRTLMGYRAAYPENTVLVDQLRAHIRAEEAAVAKAKRAPTH